MSLLENIQSGRESRPPRLMVYGSEGVGKSTFGASAPNPIFIQTEAWAKSTAASSHWQKPSTRSSPN